MIEWVDYLMKRLGLSSEYPKQGTLPSYIEAQSGRPFPSQEDVDEARRTNHPIIATRPELYERGQHVDTGGQSSIEGIASLVNLPEAQRKKYLKENPEVADMYLRNYLASTRNGISQLGYDPSKFAVETRPGNYNIGGAYMPAKDAGFVVLNQPYALNHEATHRGFKVLRDESYTTPKGADEEYAVRHLQDIQQGSVEMGAGPAGDEQILEARNKYKRNRFDENEWLDYLDKKAAEEQRRMNNESSGDYYSPQRPILQANKRSK